MDLCTLTLHFDIGCRTVEFTILLASLETCVCRYKLNSDGFYRLQTLRYESLELTEQLLARDMSSKAASADDKARDKVTSMAKLQCSRQVV